MKTTLSPRQLAVAIGVSESSLKRWADEGTIHVSRTAGGHRRIPVGEAIRFIRANRCSLVRPESLGLPDLVTTDVEESRPEAHADRFHAFLRAGKSRESRAMILSRYLAGESVAAIGDGMIRPAMDRIGKIWRHDGDGIFLEHRATDICIQAVQHLRVLIDVPDGGPSACGGAPSGDPYILPSLLAATTLAAEGFETINLGADTPLEAVATAAETHHVELAWLSMTCRPAPATERKLADLTHRLERVGAKLMIGGRSASDVAVRQLANVQVGNSLAELAAFARGLRAAGGHKLLT